MSRNWRLEQIPVVLQHILHERRIWRRLGRTTVARTVRSGGEAHPRNRIARQDTAFSHPWESRFNPNGNRSKVRDSAHDSERVKNATATAKKPTTALVGSRCHRWPGAQPRTRAYGNIVEDYQVCAWNAPPLPLADHRKTVLHPHGSRLTRSMLIMSLSDLRAGGDALDHYHSVIRLTRVDVPRPDSIAASIRV